MTEDDREAMGPHEAQEQPVPVPFTLPDRDEPEDGLEQIAADLDHDGRPDYAWRVRRAAAKLHAQRAALEPYVLPTLDAETVEPTSLAGDQEPIFDELRAEMAPSGADDEETPEETEFLDERLIEEAGGRAMLRVREQEIRRGDHGTPMDEVFAELDSEDQT